MFNSQHVNNDPEPYIGWSGERYDEDGRTYASLEDGPVDTDPRPEYDNNPNPVLEALRVQFEACPSAGLAGSAEMFLDLSERYPAGAEQAHLEHARKVLAHLANIYGAEK